jgi:hypothetical protein
MPSHAHLCMSGDDYVKVLSETHVYGWQRVASIPKNRDDATE